MEKRQIEEIAKVIDEFTEPLSARDIHKAEFSEKFAEHLTAAGYRKASEVAEEIFEEIESKILTEIDLNNCVLVEFEAADKLYNRIKGEVSALCKIQDFIAELKKKYESEKDNGESQHIISKSSGKV